MTSSIGRILLPAFAVLGVSFLTTGAHATPRAPSVAPRNSAAIPVGYRGYGYGGYGYRGGHGYRGGYGYSRHSYGYPRHYRGGYRGYRGYGYGANRRYGYGGGAAYVIQRLFRGPSYYGRRHGGYRSSHGYRSYRYGSSGAYGGGYGYSGYNYR